MADTGHPGRERLELVVTSYQARVDFKVTAEKPRTWLPICREIEHNSLIGAGVYAGGGHATPKQVPVR
jgi:hypothetical protein